jgi:CRISPR-associated endonuclease/helicase Cas3
MTSDRIAFAHSRENEPESSWEPLDVHLREVATLAARFAAAFDSAEWGRLAGLWHDLGKYRPEFQDRIRGRRVQAPHAGAGAVHAYQVGLLPLAFAVAGHHAGMANQAAQQESSQLPLKQRLSEERPTLDDIRSTVPPSILAQAKPAPPGWVLASGNRGTLEMWTRFLFSALVDADRLATEAFYTPGRRAFTSTYDAVPALRARLDAHLDAMPGRTPVDGIRRDVLADCRAAADRDPGLFSLSVPTGGGKTLSSMAFALRHAERHGMRRVIAVVPFTSIIEQNARVYRDVLGAHNVIEHHSAIDEAARRETSGELEVRRRLATDNWDAPVIVTTAVQFYETLFSNEPSRCRKLHNIARSVVLLDEAQTIPTGFLLCLLDAMRELTAHYGCTLVLSTATQPALGRRAALPTGLEGVREIVGDPAALAAKLRRVTVRWPDAGVVTPYTDVAAEMREHAQVLAVVHRREDARALAELLPTEGRFHLSTRLCGAHRLTTLDAVRRALDGGAPCRLVSTQLVEAGVDVDFPVVFRALAGLDSLAQAAGRCNRNGALVDERGTKIAGRFVVFRAETSPPASLRPPLARSEQLLASRGGALDLSDASVMEEFFRILYRDGDKDTRQIQPNRDALNFATVGDAMRLIDDGATHPLVVPWGDESPDRIAAFEQWPTREAARALQPLTVQVRDHELRVLQRLGAVAPIDGFGWKLSAPYLHLYHHDFGLMLDEDAAADAGALIQ